MAKKSADTRFGSLGIRFLILGVVLLGLSLLGAFLWAQDDVGELLEGNILSQAEAQQELLDQLPYNQHPYSYGLNLEGGLYFVHNTNARNPLKAALLSIHNSVIALNGVDDQFNPGGGNAPLTQEFYDAILLLTENYPGVLNAFNDLSTPFSYGGFFHFGMSIKWNLFDELDHYFGKLINDTFDFGVYSYMGYGSFNTLLRDDFRSSSVNVHFGGYINLFRILSLQAGAVWRIFIGSQAVLIGKYDGFRPTFGFRLRVIPLYDNTFVNFHFDTVFHTEEPLFNEYLVGVSVSYDWQKHFN